MQIQNTLASAGLAALFVASSAAALSNGDKQFMVMAAKANMTEAHEAQAAENQGTRSDVKALARMMDQDHTKAYEDLAGLAAKLNVAIPKGIDIAKDAAFERTAHLKGERYDHAFAMDEVTSHKSALAAFRREAEHGQDADVKAYASKMIPILENHLQAAQACSKPVK